MSNKKLKRKKNRMKWQEENNAEAQLQRLPSQLNLNFFFSFYSDSLWYLFYSSFATHTNVVVADAHADVNADSDV